MLLVRLKIATTVNNYSFPHIMEPSHGTPWIGCPPERGEKTKKINQNDLAPLKQWLALAGWLSGEMSAVKTAQFLLLFSYQKGDICGKK